MTTLADLISLAEKANTFGLKPEEIEVKFAVGAAALELRSGKACIDFLPDQKKPVLTIGLGYIVNTTEIR